jgi:hypothetical protein
VLKKIPCCTEERTFHAGGGEHVLNTRDALGSEGRRIRRLHERLVKSKPGIERDVCGERIALELADVEPCGSSPIKAQSAARALVRRIVEANEDRIGTLFYALTMAGATTVIEEIMIVFIPVLEVRRLNRLERGLEGYSPRLRGRDGESQTKLKRDNCRAQGSREPYLYGRS